MMESEVGRSTTTTFRSGSSLCDVLLGEYHSRPEDYKDVRIRFEDGSTLESCRLLLGCLSEVLFDSLGSIPPWEDAEILVPGLNPLSTRCFLQRLLQMPSVEDTTSNQVQGEEEQEIIRAFGFDVPPRLERRLRAYHCEDCDVFCPRDGILSHVRDCHPLSRKALSSPIWSFFEATEHPDFHLCRECKSVIKDKSQSTLTLISHLETSHPGLHERWTLSSKEEKEDDDSYFSHLDGNITMACNLCFKVFKMGKAEDMRRHLKMEHPGVNKNASSPALSYFSKQLEECPEEEHGSLKVEPMDDDDDVESDFGAQENEEEEDTIEESQEMYGCKLCPVMLKAPELLSLHMRIVHPVVNNSSEEGESPSIQEDEHFTNTLDGKQQCKVCRQIFPSDSSPAERLEHFRTEHHTGATSEEQQGQPASEHDPLKEEPVRTKKRSLVWNYFDSTDEPSVNRCNICYKVFQCKGQTTSSMIRHIKFEHPDAFDEFESLSKSNEDERSNITMMMEEGSNSSMTATGKPVKRRSSIWNYFEGTEEHEMNACRVCNRIFKCKGQTTSSMIRHLKKEHVELFMEFLCNKDKPPRDPSEVTLSISKEKMRSPIWNYFERTERPGTNECLTCKKQFQCKGQSTFNMIQHLESTHPGLYNSFLGEGGRSGVEETQICAECGNQFTNRSALTQHMKVAHASSCPYKCEICNATFTRRESYEQHSHDKNKPRNFLCTICGKTFARRSIRDFHEKAHDAIKKYECAYCPKKFLTNQRKYKHERTHTGEKPYQCTDCGRQFTLSHHLVTHSRIHTGQKPYTCEFCPQTFRHLSSRNNHKCEGKLRLTIQNAME